jgi:hypothetical protein
LQIQNILDNGGALSGPGITEKAITDVFSSSKAKVDASVSDKKFQPSPAKKACPIWTPDVTNAIVIFVLSLQGVCHCTLEGFYPSIHRLFVSWKSRAAHIPEFKKMDSDIHNSRLKNIDLDTLLRALRALDLSVQHGEKNEPACTQDELDRARAEGVAEGVAAANEAFKEQKKRLLAIYMEVRADLLGQVQNCERLQKANELLQKQAL